jgi:hypothetical protein
MENIKTQLQLQSNVTGVKPPFNGIVSGLIYNVKTTGSTLFFKKIFYIIQDYN